MLSVDINEQQFYSIWQVQLAFTVIVLILSTIFMYD